MSDLRRALMEAQWANALLGKPSLADDEVPVVLGMAPSSWQALKASGKGPPIFRIGKRVFVRTRDLLAWLDLQAKAAGNGEKIE